MQITPKQTRDYFLLYGGVLYLYLYSIQPDPDSLLAAESREETPTPTGPSLPVLVPSPSSTSLLLHSSRNSPHSHAYPAYLPAHRRPNRIPIYLPPTTHLFINLPLHLCIPSPSASLDGGRTRVHRSRQAKRSALTPPPMEAPTAHRNLPHTTTRLSQSPPDSDR